MRQGIHLKLKEFEADELEYPPSEDLVFGDSSNDEVGCKFRQFLAETFMSNLNLGIGGDDMVI